MNIHGYKQKIKEANKKIKRDNWRSYTLEKRMIMWRNCIKKLRKNKSKKKK